MAIIMAIKTINSCTFKDNGKTNEIICPVCGKKQEVEEPCCCEDDCCASETECDCGCCEDKADEE